MHINIERLAFLFVIALPLGLVLEGAFSFLAPLMLQFIPNIAELLAINNPVVIISKFLFFHLFGWLLGREVADAVEMDPEDDWYDEKDMYDDHFAFERDGHVIEVFVH